MYIVYCQNKPKSEHIVSEYIDTYFEVRIHTLPPPHTYPASRFIPVSLTEHIFHPVLIPCVIFLRSPLFLLCATKSNGSLCILGAQAASGPQTPDH